MGHELWVSPITGYRRKGTKYKSLKKIFIDNVTAKNIFEPLLCCPLGAKADESRKALNVREFDVAGVKETEGGEVIGYVVTKELDSGEIINYMKKIGPELLISDSTALSDIFRTLDKREFSFVLYGKHIVGIVTKADINKPPVRIYLFGMVSLFEMHLNAWINHFYPKNRWMKRLPEKRLRSAHRIYDLRKGNNQDLSLLECLQFCDKRTILKETEKFIKEFNFTKSNFEAFVKNAEKIRNELAHSQDSIISNIVWREFINTVNKLEYFLLISDDKVEQTALRGNDFRDLLVPST